MKSKYFKNTNNIKLKSVEDWNSYINQYVQTKDNYYLEIILDNIEPMVWAKVYKSVKNKHTKDKELQEDMFFNTIAHIRDKIHLFDTSRGTKFTTYAFNMIHTSLQQYFNKYISNHKTLNYVGNDFVIEDTNNNYVYGEILLEDLLHNLKISLTPLEYEIFDFLFIQKKTLHQTLKLLSVKISYSSLLIKKEKLKNKVKRLYNIKEERKKNVKEKR